MSLTLSKVDEDENNGDDESQTGNYQSDEGAMSWLFAQKLQNTKRTAGIDHAIANLPNL